MPVKHGPNTSHYLEEIMISDTTNTLQIGNLDVNYESDTGQILSVYDRSVEMEVISFAPGHELEINGLPFPLRLVHQDPL